MLRSLFMVLCLGTAVQADTLVLTNAKVWTVNPDQPWASAVAITDGKISAVGTLENMPQADHIVDLKGQMVLPGFQDIHVHAVEAGVNEILCVFEAFDDMDGHIASVKDCAENGNTGDWVLGSNVNIPNLLDLHENPKAVLDMLVPDRPVLILDDIGHGAWANSLALAEVGYDANHDKPGNIILLNDAATPNGVILENAPHNLRTRAFLPTDYNLDFAYESLIAASKTLNSYGITTVSDAGGYWPQGHHKVWDWAEDAGDLTVRAANAFYIYPDRPLDVQIEALKGLQHNDPDRLVRFNTAKVYVDGILSQRTGAVLTPYEDEATEGYLYFTQRTLKDAVQKLDANGFQINFHVVGDYAARLALDAVEASDQTSGPHRLTHLYLVADSDMLRFKDLGVVADFQMAPSAIGFGYRSFIRDAIGNRVDRLLPAGDVIRSGALVTLSSDWDADEVNPMIKIAVAVGRIKNGFPDVETAIQAMTLNPAQALNHADRTGSIEVGKLADLVILSANILDIDVGDVADVKVQATLLGGKVVFDRSGLFKP